MAWPTLYPMPHTNNIFRISLENNQTIQNPDLPLLFKFHSYLVIEDYYNFINYYYYIN